MTKTIEIKNRWTQAILFATEVADDDQYPTRTALEKAIAADANLAGANLADANLARANLADANLARANLADANLADAYLAGAYLADANLADANLADAYLAGAKNVPSSTIRSDPPDQYKPAVTDEERKARRAERIQWYRQHHPHVPVVENLDRKILDAIDAGGTLEMSSWHGEGGACGTTHCRAGWAIALAGPAGLELERKHGAEHAGAMIYRASTGRVPYFFASNERAIADIRRCAEESAENQQ